MLVEVETVGSEETVPMKYLGMEIKESKCEIHFNQDSYIESCEEVETKDKTDQFRVLNDEEQAMCR